MKRSGPIARTTELRSNPETTRAWEDRSRRTSTLGRGPGPKRGKTLRARNPERAAATFARAFHSKERVAFVKSLPCCVCGAVPTPDYPSQNAHISIGGTSYRADYDQIVPLCDSCHKAQEARTAAFEAERGLPAGFLATCASETDGRWQTQMNR